VSIGGLNLVSARLETSQLDSRSGSCFFGRVMVWRRAKEDRLASFAVGLAPRETNGTLAPAEGPDSVWSCGTGARNTALSAAETSAPTAAATAKAHGFPDSGHHSHSFTSVVAEATSAKRVLADINSALAAAAMKQPSSPVYQISNMT